MCDAGVSPFLISVVVVTIMKYCGYFSLTYRKGCKIDYAAEFIPSDFDSPGGGLGQLL